MRFWIVAGLAVAFGLGLFYNDFLAGRGDRVSPQPPSVRMLTRRPSCALRRVGVLIAGLRVTGLAVADGPRSVRALPCGRYDAAPAVVERASCGDARRGASTVAADPQALLRDRRGRRGGRQPRTRAPASTGAGRRRGRRTVSPIWSEPELAWRLLHGRTRVLVAVTGTNGKTTTTELIAACLDAPAGRQHRPAADER